MGVFDVQSEDDARATKRGRIDEDEKLKVPATEPSSRSMIEIKVDDTW